MPSRSPVHKKVDVDADNTVSHLTGYEHFGGTKYLSQARVAAVFPISFAYVHGCFPPVPAPET